MSHTDKTDPWEVQMARSLGLSVAGKLNEFSAAVCRSWYRVHTGHFLTIGGASGNKGHAKLARKSFNGQRRTRDRDFCREASRTSRNLLDDLDIGVLHGDKHSFAEKPQFAKRYPPRILS